MTENQPETPEKKLEQLQQQVAADCSCNECLEIDAMTLRLLAGRRRG